MVLGWGSITSADWKALNLIEQEAYNNRAKYLNEQAKKKK